MYSNLEPENCLKIECFFHLHLRNDPLNLYFVIVPTENVQVTFE